jgi:RNA polymerase-binding transcription factor DksA
MAKKSPASSSPKKSAVKKEAHPKESANKSSPLKKVGKKLADKKTAPKETASKSNLSEKPTPKVGKKALVATPITKAKTTNKTSVSSSAKPDKAVSSSTSSASPEASKGKGRDALRSRILGKAKATKSISFSLDEVKAIARTTRAKKEETIIKKTTKLVDKTAEIEARLAAAKPARVAAASLADILGFNPAAGAKPIYNDPKLVPEKFRRYYKLLIELRTHLTGQIDQHAEDTLKRSTKEDSGDLSSYGQHMADAGTDTFDRDFALSLVANEQDALSEIEAAINRIHKGTYGMCEISGKHIDKERLLAVPFARNSAEAQKELERNRYRVRSQAGLLLDAGDDDSPMRDSSSDDE